MVNEEELLLLDRVKTICGSISRSIESIFQDSLLHNYRNEILNNALADLSDSHDLLLNDIKDLEYLAYKRLNEPTLEYLDKDKVEEG